jgi:putative aminopeptidase FrvX
MADWELLEQLTALAGVSGFEEPVRRFIVEHLGRLDVERHVDSLGNVVAHIPGQGPRVLFVAHMDEVGHVVSWVRDDGYLRIERVGGPSSEALSGQAVQVWTASGSHAGVVGVYPQHLQKQRPGSARARHFVDIGVASRAEALALGVKVGAVVTYAPNFAWLGERLIRSKALDDRAGCYLLLQLAAQWVGRESAADLFLAFVVQEESTLRAGVPVARSVGPQYAIGLDGTLAFDTPDLRQTEQSEVVLGKGPALKILDHVPGTLFGTIVHAGLREHIEAVASEKGIALQYEVLMGLTTAISPLAFVREGIATAGLSIPLRYSHSPVEVASSEDIEATAGLLDALVVTPWSSEQPSSSA